MQQRIELVRSQPPPVEGGKPRSILVFGEPRELRLGFGYLVRAIDYFKQSGCEEFRQDLNTHIDQIVLAPIDGWALGLSYQDPQGKRTIIIDVRRAHQVLGQRGIFSDPYTGTVDQESLAQFIAVIMAHETNHQKYKTADPIQAETQARTYASLFASVAKMFPWVRNIANQSAIDVLTNPEAFRNYGRPTSLPVSLQI